MDEEDHYRPINIEFLNSTGKEHFDVFYRTESFGSVNYVKFASSRPEHQEKFRRLLESGELLQEFYIHETDLFKYYEQATQTLRTVVASPSVPMETKTKKIYEVSKNVMKEFFEYNTSSKILNSSEEVMGLMDSCMQQSEIGFYAIAKITNKDYYTYTHSVNVGLYCMTFGVKCKMSHDDIKLLGLGGMLHDVGKSRIPHEIINKNGKLSEQEFAVMKQHSPYGQEILEEMMCYGPAVTTMAGQHHEKFKGGGYPRGLKGDEISLYARICKIMDVYDALSTRRSYKKAMAAFDVLTLMKKQMGEEFDQVLLDKFILLMGPDM
ncbi:MAG: HD-GYP domain-containing protein [Nitrospinae bacterium]|nr:HD-GYP domain-containing protein [Nitrospinota bacterium]